MEGPFAAYFKQTQPTSSENGPRASTTGSTNYWKAIVATMRKLCKVLYGLANPTLVPSAPYSRTICVCQFAPDVGRRSVGNEPKGSQKSEASKVRLLTRRYANCTAFRLDIYPNIYPVMRSG